MKKASFLFFAIVMAMASFTQRAASAENQLWWGYFADEDVSNLKFDGHLGYSMATTLTAGIRVPANHPIASGGTVKAVRFWLGDDISAISSDLTLWIATQLPGSESDYVYKQTVAKSSLRSRKNEITLTTPFKVNKREFYIGFSFSISSRSYPVMGAGEEIPGSWYYRVANGDWEDFYGTERGNLAFQMLLGGVSLGNNSAAPFDFGTNYVEAGGSVNVPVSIFNAGKQPISSIAYTITTEGSVSGERTLTFGDLAYNKMTTVNISFPSDSEAKKKAKTLTITKVNGAKNESTTATASGVLITVKEKPVVIPVVEEVTATWCPWCPLGIEGMEAADKTFGDQVVLVAVHLRDEMSVNDYSPIASMAHSYPTSFINRATEVYPSKGWLEYIINQYKRNTTVGAIKATAAWADADKSAIRIKTETQFAYTDNDGQYGIAFVLIEDGMSGADWEQANSLSGNENYKDYTFWYNAGQWVSGLKYNHVGVAAWGIVNGIDGSVNKVIKAGETQKYSYKADISSRGNIQDKTKLTVAALLIDRTNGTIVNAAKTAISAYTPSATGIEQVSTDSETMYFSLDGRRLTAPQPGVNIVNGRKVIFKR